MAEIHQATIDRFTQLCQADPRVVAAFLGGSYASGTADEHSDLDLYLVTSHTAYADFFAGRMAFIRRLGDPVFAEDFNGFGFDMIVFIFANHVEGELALAGEDRFGHIHGGPFKVLVDKKDILSEADFPLNRPSLREQRQALHHLVHWFWRDVSLFLTALKRKRLWTAYGYLESLRLKCINLACLRLDFTMWAEGYEKLEQIVDTRELAPLQATFVPLSREAMFDAVHTLVRFYQEIASELASQHGEPYPLELEQLLLRRLEEQA
jgi:predicted nucleotidyltransferase